MGNGGFWNGYWIGAAITSALWFVFCYFFARWQHIQGIRWACEMFMGEIEKVQKMDDFKGLAIDLKKSIDMWEDDGK